MRASVTVSMFADTIGTFKVMRREKRPSVHVLARRDRRALGNEQHVVEGEGLSHVHERIVVELNRPRQRIYSMDSDEAVARAAARLRELRRERRISQRQLADEAGVNPALVNRVERGRDARLSTWAKLFEGLGYRFEATELCEEAADLLALERGRRWQRRHDGLCVGKRRF
jgi:DNA-binding XRE family transcriptional regulator